jgi:hypothetical protein
MLAKPPAAAAAALGLALALLAPGRAEAQIAPIPAALDRTDRARDVERAKEKGEPAPKLPDDAGFFLGLDLYGASPGSSQTRVRENGDEGDILKFQDDLGITVVGETRLRFGYRFDSDNALEIGISHIFCWGGTTVPRDIHYNGSTIAAGSSLDSMPRWLVFEFNYERVLVSWGEQGRGELDLDLGIRFDYLHWDFQNFHFTATSSGHEAAEDFDTQAMPIPMIGLSIRQPLVDHLDFTAFGRGFRANLWPTGRTEGGPVTWSETAIEAGAGLAWRIADSFEIYLGYRFLLLDIKEQSGEDGNFVTLRANGGLLGMTVFF